jgi:SAM-dependent methyltransferase
MQSIDALSLMGFLAIANEEAESPVVWTGSWNIRFETRGAIYSAFSSDPGSTLTLHRLRGPARLEIMCTAWSGTLEIESEGKTVLVDTYSPEHRCKEFELSGQGERSVRIRLLEGRHPQARDRQIWIHRLLLDVRPAWQVLHHRITPALSWVDGDFGTSMVPEHDRPVSREFRDRFQHAWNKLEWHVPPALRTGRFLDVGCGLGNGVAAAAVHGAALAVGIDKDLELFGPNDFAARCREVSAPVDSTLLIEADLFEIGLPKASFDYALMLDSAEHVPQPGRFFNRIYDLLRPGGYLVMDTSPLFYSAVGHHLFSYFDAPEMPWAHLRHDFEELCRERGVSDWHLRSFAELNRATHQSLRDDFLATGFEVVQEHRAEPQPDTEELLERHHSRLNLEGIDRRWLFEDWILLVGRRPGPDA